MGDVTLTANLVGNDQSLSKTMRKAGDEVDNVGKKSKNTGDIMKGILGSQIVSGAVDALGSFIGEAANATDQTDKFKKSLQFAGLKNGAIEKATKGARAYADDTVYDLGTIQNTVSQLAANGVKDYVGLTKAAGNLNAVSGGNAETFKSVAQMLTQTAGAGKLSTENWNQLAEAIPGASGVLQEQLKKNGAYTGNFREAMSKGKITADEFNTALSQVGNKPVAVEAAKSTKTFEGALGNLSATVTGKLSDAIAAIKPTLVGFINGLSAGVQWISENVSWLGPLAAGLGIVAGAWALVNGAMALTNALAAANPFGLVVIAIGLLIGGLIWAYNNVGWFRDGVNTAFSAIGNAARWLWNNAFAPALRAIVNGFAWVMEAVAGFLDSLGNIPGFEWAKGAADGLRGLAKSAREAATGIKEIPDPKIDTGPVGKKLKDFQSKINGLKGKIVEAKAKGDSREVDRLNKKLRDMRKSYTIYLKAVKTGISKIFVTGNKAGTEFGVHARAFGGGVKANRPYWVGENGPELFWPGSTGGINNQFQMAVAAQQAARGNSAGAGGNIYNRVTIEAHPGTDLRALGRTVEKALIQVQSDRSGRALAFKTR